MTDESKSYTYISYQPCGCIGMSIIDNPDHKNFVAEQVARAIKQGEVVERIATESLRAMEWQCPKHKLESVLDETTKQMRLPDENSTL